MVNGADESCCSMKSRIDTNSKKIYWEKIEYIYVKILVWYGRE
jgi:hypothetical protein